MMRVSQINLWKSAFCRLHLHSQLSGVIWSVEGTRVNMAINYSPSTGGIHRGDSIVSLVLFPIGFCGSRADDCRESCRRKITTVDKCALVNHYFRAFCCPRFETSSISYLEFFHYPEAVKMKVCSWSVHYALLSWSVQPQGWLYVG